mmetsp:Transcript_73214/g.231240  ORF Transcript_73214/g.231240 Transcript_73214/m.231240 type:complete len:239 (-) Transcript_73214:304-1020(-)
MPPLPCRLHGGTSSGRPLAPAPAAHGAEPSAARRRASKPPPVVPSHIQADGSSAGGGFSVGVPGGRPLPVARELLLLSCAAAAASPASAGKSLAAAASKTVQSAAGERSPSCTAGRTSFSCIIALCRRARSLASVSRSRKRSEALLPGLPARLSSSSSTQPGPGPWLHLALALLLQLGLRLQAPSPQWLLLRCDGLADCSPSVQVLSSSAGSACAASMEPLPLGTVWDGASRTEAQSS